MAGVSLERHTTMKFTAAHLMTFNKVKALFDEDKRALSSGFSCADDLDQAKFKMQVTFHRDEGRLSISVGPTTRPVMVRRLHFTLFDSNGRVLKSQAWAAYSAQLNDFRGTQNFYTSVGLADNVTWRVKCVLDYDGVSANADLDFIEPRDPETVDHMLKLLEDAKDTDVDIIVGTETIKAHKLILVARSTYFQNMFQSGMEESRSNEVRVPNASPDMVREMLKFIYSGAAPKNILRIGTQLLPLADQYGLDKLKKMCESAVGSRISVDNVIEVLLLADLHNCPKLTKRCIPLFKANVASLKQSASWAKLKANPYLIVSLLENCF